MRWLLLKDLQILRRSPLLVGLLIVYPIAIALLIGLALSRGPEKPKVAFVNLVPKSANTFKLGGQEIDASKYADQLFQSVQPVRVRSRAEAIAKVKDGEVLGALIVPADITEKLSSGLQSAEVEVIYNNEDPVKGRYVEQIINSRLADANTALAEKLRGIAVQDIKLLLDGGDFDLFGRTINILGLRKTQSILATVLRSLPPGAVERARLARVEEFASLAVANLNLASDVVGTVSQPVKVKRTPLAGKRTPLDSFAVALAVTVSLMFVTVLLASGMLALEREEHAFTRLVRGLVSRTGLLAEKVGLSALCAWVVALAMTCGIGLFVSLDWGRFPLWLVALAFGAAGFGAMGVAIGSLAREVRAASLLAFLLSLPIAFLALVPSGAVSAGLYDAVRVVSALFPFRPALDAMDSALNDTGQSLLGPLAHLAGLTLAFLAIARVALRRFG
ncbi:MAG: type transport system permease protein [Solirubrobacteraceae bacterium]|jgi:ABC-2 type transport system permease protein|nr:type transport system permease protein [Solirubrobacteraceae bacterium]